jgi:hypothetical protein
VVLAQSGSADILNSVMASNRGEEVGLLIENVVAYWFRIVMQALIPLLRIVDDFFLSKFITVVTEGLISTVFGSNRLSAGLAVEWELAAATDDLWNQVYEYEATFGEGSDGEAIEGEGEAALRLFIGHGAGGLIAKGLALRFEAIGIAYEAPQFVRSPVSGLFGEFPEARELKILNFHSGSTLLAMEEAKAKVNGMLPTWQKLWAPATHSQTFCLLAAGCAIDDRYDALCNELVGQGMFRAYFKSWGRERNETMDGE